MSGVLILLIVYVVVTFLIAGALALVSRWLRYPRRGFGRALLIAVAWTMLAVGNFILHMTLLGTSLSGPMEWLSMGAVWVLEIGLLYGVYKATLGKALAGWGILVGVRIALLVVLLVFVRGYVVEAFAETSTSMVPTLFGRHATTVCPRCGNAVLYHLEEWDLQRRAALQMPRQKIDDIEIDGICLSCGQTEQAVVSSLQAIPADRFLAVKVLAPKRWDLVAFRLHQVILLKRVIGMPGDSISIDANGVLSINGAAVQSPAGVPAKFPWLDPKVVNPEAVRYALNPGATMRLGTDEYFVIGDRAQASSDSRMDGPIHGKDLVGVATTVYWPLSRARILR